MQRWNRVNGATSGCVDICRCTWTLAGLGQSQRRDFSGMTTVVTAARKHDDKRAQVWHQCHTFWQTKLFEVCTRSGSPFVRAVESVDGEGLRVSFWNGHDITLRRGQDRLCVSCCANNFLTTSHRSQSQLVPIPVLPPPLLPRLGTRNLRLFG